MIGLRHDTDVNGRETSTLFGIDLSVIRSVALILGLIAAYAGPLGFGIIWLQNMYVVQTAIASDFSEFKRSVNAVVIAQIQSELFRIKGIQDQLVQGNTPPDAMYKLRLDRVEKDLATIAEMHRDISAMQRSIERNTTLLEQMQGKR